MIDATSLPGGDVWLFIGTLTNLNYTLTLTDTVTGHVKHYVNASYDSSHLCGGADTKVSAPDAGEGTP